MNNIIFHCAQCNGVNLVSDAPCMWDVTKQEWVRTGEVYDDTFCQDCEENVNVTTTTF
ncbi:hypothetical protein Xoosp13_37 [Xanthomonas phage Xoo-sp13]|nr:hypothetical protein Xoosp13_37 [Xanthomonas phage Xoo-sp13]